METLWQNLLADIDRQDTPTAQSALHTLLQSLTGDSLTEPALRHLILRLGLLSVAAPGAFITLRPLILAALSAAPSLARTLLQAQLAQDDGTPHADIIRHLVAQSDMELLQHIAGSVPSRTAPMLRKALNTAFLRDLADQNLHSARYIAAVALAAINESAADHLTQAPCPSESSPPSEAVSQIIEARVTRLAASHAPAVHRPRLRVALCISGQLRGWRTALKSWAPFFQGGHEVEIFVHTWQDVGRKLPHYPHYHRSFTGCFLQELNRATSLSDASLLPRAYPALTGWFAQGETIERDMLQDAYRTTNIVIEDDRAAPFAAMSNSEKMYTKVESCFDLVRASFRSFDVIARMRPDKSLYPSERFDWREALHLSQQRSAILADYAAVLHPHSGFVMADQFACGTDAAMAIYSRTASFSRAAWAANLHGFPRGFVPHCNFATTCLMNGLLIAATPGLLFGELNDPDRMPAETVLTLLRQDLAARPSDEFPANEFDTRLLTAAEQDAAGPSAS